MMKFLLLLSFGLLLTQNSNAQIVNIPDANFKSYLLGISALNTNLDAEIQVSEANSWSGSLNCNNLSISDLTGVEALTYLIVLNAAGNSITSADLSQNTSLTQILLNSNNLTSLNVANGYNTNIVQFNALNNPNLSCIQVDDASYSTTNWVNLEAVTNFSTDCSCTINVPDANFKSYLLGNNNININGDTEIQCTEAAAYTGTIGVYGLSISDLTGIEEFTAITILDCGNNQLTSLNVSQNTALTELYCPYNQIASLDVTQLTSLLELYCTTNLIPSLDVSNNSGLTILECNNNNLSTLDVTQNTNLMNLSCASNSLSVLDISANTSLILLDCQNDQITSLDVSNNVNLTNLFCAGNQMMFLDVSQNPNLVQFNCGVNPQLSLLNIQNGNNTNIISFNASLTNNLTCIQVDDVAWSTTNWLGVDPTASFSTNCAGGALVNSIIVQGLMGATTIDTPAGTLQMEAFVLPANASDPSYTWSVANGTGAATIDANGLLTAIADGTVNAIASANDASGVTGSIEITLSNQTTGLSEMPSNLISVYPNPTNDVLHIGTDSEHILEVQILNFSGRVVYNDQNISSNEINISNLESGGYIIRMITDERTYTVRFVKQ